MTANETGRRAGVDAARLDVAIVGLGPVGATLAHLLAMQGLRVAAFDREPDVYPLPRAVAFDGEVMRVFQAIGVADALLPELRVGPGMHFVDARGRMLMQWNRPLTPGPQGWHHGFRFHQPTLELEIRRQLAARDGVQVRLRHEVFAIDALGEGLRLRFEDLSNGSIGSLEAAWVVGCDGARSLVRRLMGTELDDMRSHERWLVVDVLLKRDIDALGDFSIQYCDPARPCTYVRAPGARRRWELMLMPDDDPARITREDTIWRLLSRWITPADAAIERHALYTFHSVVASGWRRDRMMIAGDAAHQTPPFLGQGMCAGIRDAANLAWKLAAVAQARAPATLLDTYEAERSPHVREFIETAVRLGAIIQNTDPQASAARDAEMAANPRSFTIPQPSLGAGAHEDGRIAPQPTLADGSRLDSRTGYRHALVVRAALGDAVRARLAGMRARGVPIFDCAVSVADTDEQVAWLDAEGADAILLRPDRYLQARALGMPSIEAMLERWLPGGGAGGAQTATSPGVFSACPNAPR